MEKTRVMICGASGFIGRNLFEYYNSINGYETYGTYLKNRPKNFNPRIFQADLRDKDEASFVTAGMDIVINAAAMTDGIGVFSEEKNAKTYAEANNLINANLAEAVSLNRVSHYISLSCTVMYPSSDIPLSEDGVDMKKIHPKYFIPAEMKIFAEERCRHFSNLGSTKYTVIRHTNIYGPYDKFDLARGHVLAATITKVIKAKDKIIVWGKGEESRDFLYIDDLIEFIRKAVDLQESNFEIFNVGSGKTYSINELVKIIIARSGKKLDIIHDLTKPSVETQMNICVEKAKHLLNWQAKTELHEGISRTIEWYRNNCSA